MTSDVYIAGFGNKMHMYLAGYLIWHNQNGAATIEILNQTHWARVPQRSTLINMSKMPQRFPSILGICIL